MADADKNEEPGWKLLTTTDIKVVGNLILQKMFGKIENQPWDVTNNVHDDNGQECECRVGGSGSSS